MMPSPHCRTMLRGIARTVLSFALFGILMFRAISYGTVRGIRLPLRSGIHPRVTSSTRLLSSEVPNFSDGTQVSKHFTVPQEDLLTVLKKFQTDIREKPDGQYVLKECKLCNKRNRDKPDNVWKLNVWPSGSYNCFRCSTSGNWYDLQQKACGSYMPDSEAPEVNVFSAKSKGAAGSPDSTGDKTSAAAKAPYVIPNQWGSSKPFDNLFPDETRLLQDTEEDRQRRQQVKSYLNSVRGLNDEVLRKYNVGFATQEFLNDQNDWKGELCISFPWQMKRDALQGMTLNYTNALDAKSKRENIIVRTKYRALSTKGLQRISPKGGMWGLFGWHTVPPSAPTDEERAIILTEGEYDAMAAWQGLSVLPADDPLRHIPVVSLPNGCNSLPTELIPLLEPFSKIYLWLDFDKSGQDACAKFVTKLGAHRCAIVKPGDDMPNPPKDANDALRQGDPALIPAMIRAAQLPTNEMFVTFADERASVLQGIEGMQEHAGSVSTSLPGLTDLCKGFRRGELVIFTGPTGSGKTTLLSQLGLDFAQQGRPTLWGSFEVKNVQLMGKMMQQFHKTGKLSKLSKAKLHQVANDFEALPIKFLNFHGATNIDQIIAAMDHAVYRDDIQHIIIDNLQFMTSNLARGSSGGSGSKKSNANPFYEAMAIQDMVVDKLRAFATEKDVNVILVMHPRKEEEGVRLSMSSVFGSAKATQEADLVLILQRFQEKAFLEVKKNRFDGVTGSVNIAFNAMNTCYEEVPASSTATMPTSAYTSRAPASTSSDWEENTAADADAYPANPQAEEVKKPYRRPAPKSEVEMTGEPSATQTTADRAGWESTGTRKYTKSPSTAYQAGTSSGAYKKSTPSSDVSDEQSTASPHAELPPESEAPAATKYAYTRPYKKASTTYDNDQYERSKPSSEVTAAPGSVVGETSQVANTGGASDTRPAAPKYTYKKAPSSSGAYKRTTTTKETPVEGEKPHTPDTATSTEGNSDVPQYAYKRTYTKKATSSYDSYQRPASSSEVPQQDSTSAPTHVSTEPAAVAPKYSYTSSYKKPAAAASVTTGDTSAAEAKYTKAPNKSGEEVTASASSGDATADKGWSSRAEASYAKPTAAGGSFAATPAPAINESAVQAVEPVPRKYTRRSEQQGEKTTTPGASATSAAEAVSVAAEASAAAAPVTDTHAQPATQPRAARTKSTTTTKSASVSKKKLAAIARLEAAEKLEEVIKWPPRNAPTVAPTAASTGEHTVQG